MNFKFIKGVFLQVVMFILLIPKYIMYKCNPKRYSLNDIFKSVQKHTDKSLKSLGVTLDVEGKENIPKDTNVLFVANHSNWVDGVVMLSAVDRPTGMIIAKEANWEKFKIIDGWLKLFNCLYIDRSSARSGLKTINEGADILKTKSSIGVFPEGKVTLSENLSSFKSGVFKMAQRGSVPVVPIVIKNTKDIYKPNNRWTGKVFSKNVTVKILPPVYDHLLDKKVSTKEISDIVFKRISDELNSIHT